MSAPRVVTERLGGSKLTRAALDGKAPAHWYRKRPETVEDWRDHALSIRDRFGSRDWLTPLLPALAPTGAARERIEHVARGGGVVITTGQQAGLFGGPVYTWAKALSALAIADSLEASIGVPVAPVFWAATDDTDFAEASVTHVAVVGGVERLALGTQQTSGSMHDTPLGDVRALLTALERGAGGTVNPAVIVQVRAIYESKATIGEAYVSLLRELLEPLGVAVLDAGHSAVRKAAHPLLIRALVEEASISDALDSRDREIRSHGFEPQVPLIHGLSLVFSSDSQGRSRVPVADAGEVATREGTTLGSTVLLRPLIEQQLLPTASYVAGPAEIAYFAQTGAAADALGLPVPIVLPRWSCTIIEPHIARLLSRYDLVKEDFVDPHAAEARVAKNTIPSGVTSALTHVKERLGTSVDDLRDALLGADSKLRVPAAVADGFNRDVGHRIARLERRIVAAAKRSERARMSDIATIRAALYPLGKRQERVLNLIPMLARHGSALFQAMLDSARNHAAELIPRRLETGESHRAAGEISASPG